MQNYATVVERMRDVRCVATFLNYWCTEQLPADQTTHYWHSSTGPVWTLDAHHSVHRHLGLWHSWRPHTDTFRCSERTVAFASCSLSVAESSKYWVVEKEAVCVWATEHWRTYLWEARFVLRNDQQALTTLLATKGMGRVGMTIPCWSARLLCLNYVSTGLVRTDDTCSGLPFLLGAATWTGLPRGTRDWCCCCLNLVLLFFKCFTAKMLQSTVR